MTLDEAIRELCVIRATFRDSGDWELVASDDATPAPDSWYGLSRMQAMSEDREVRLT